MGISALHGISVVVVGVFFLVAGINHFWHPRFYERIVPPWLPMPKALVAVSGIAEIAGGIGVLIPPLRLYAGLWLVALLVAIFPANVYMAQHPQRFEKIRPTLLYARLPLQVVLIVWVWWSCAAN